jgi:agmatine/peptidylarginine deiminase
MLTWPHIDTDWAPILQETETLYVEIVSHIARHEQVLIACHNQALRSRIQALLQEADIPADSILLGIAPNNDTWARDHGPLTVIEGNEPVVVDFRFNGWGGKYAAELDNLVIGELAAGNCFGDTPLRPVKLVLEGGAVETDGTGTLLATESSVITETRNPGMDRSEIEQLLHQHLGLTRFLWLKNGHLSGDDTDGHIDTLARFCDGETIIHVTCLPEDEDYAQIEAMRRELEAFRTADGRPYRLVPLPPLQPQYDADGDRLPATYANFLIINGAVLLPVYGDPADAAACHCLQGCFPDREIIPIDCRPLIRQNGSLHCITMQLPALVKLKPE